MSNRKTVKALAIFLLSLVTKAAWACTLTDESLRKFELLCPTKKLESDCTCNIAGISVDVLGVGTGQSSVDLIAITGIIAVGIALAIYFKKKGVQSQPKEYNDST